MINPLPKRLDIAAVIAAISTAITSSAGGIGIIRISGAGALQILQRLFVKKISGPFRQTKQPLSCFSFTPRLMEHGWVCDAAGIPLDEILAVFMPGPHTFTGEDVAEIHCHGGRAVLQATLAAVLASGARLAEPGEFTRRAFLNGRMDLSQAEAVAEMISSPTLQGVYLARNKLAGRLGVILDELRTELDLLRAKLCLCIDFPDDADQALARSDAESADFMNSLTGIIARITELVLAYERAGVWREGAQAVLAGQVNVGKSSLLNALLGRKRALVSAIPGTTRDFIEETLNLDGLPLRLVDTAGFRGSSGKVEAGELADKSTSALASDLSGDLAGELEAEGIDFAREVIAGANVILLVLDARKFVKNNTIAAGSPADLDPESAELYKLYAPKNSKLFIILNKMDLCPGYVAPEYFFGCPCQAVSAKSGFGLDSLATALRKFIVAPHTDRGEHAKTAELDFSSEAVPGLRQTLKLKEVKAELQALQKEFKEDIPADLLSVRLDSAAAYLADVTGASCTEEILDQVFARFCIGK